MPLFMMILIVLGVGAVGFILVANIVDRYGISQILDLFEPVPYTFGWAIIGSFILVIVSQLFEGVISLESSMMAVIGGFLGLSVGVWQYVKEHTLQEF
jgi:hypothetical protein